MSTNEIRISVTGYLQCTITVRIFEISALSMYWNHLTDSYAWAPYLEILLIILGCSLGFKVFQSCLGDCPRKLEKETRGPRWPKQEGTVYADNKAAQVFGCRSHSFKKVHVAWDLSN